MRGNIDGSVPIKVRVTITAKLLALWRTVYKWLCAVEYRYGHNALGALTLIALFVHPVLAIIWAWLYVKYQVREYVEKPDTCALDIRDFMWGFGIAFGLAFVIIFLCKMVH